MTTDKILIIDSEKLIRQTLSDDLKKRGFATIEANTLTAALKLLDLYSPIVTLLGTNLPDGAGADDLHEIKKRQPDAVVILMTGNVRIEEVGAGLRGGAYDFIAKPVHLEELYIRIQHAIKAGELSREARQLHQQQANSFRFDQIIGESPAIRETISLARKIAASDVGCVLLQGESGTGKDLVAKAIHYGSNRAHKPFVAINCAAIPANLLESELFGFEKGAFTDAKARKEGLFEQAEGGTLFLDEIGELNIELQAKLLRVLEEGSFRRVGGLRDLPLNVRIIAASNRNLRNESETKNFRLDLFYRLSIIEIDLPPLRLRGDDVLLLAEHFIKTLDKKWHRSPARKLSREAAEMFRRYRWVGNVRELRNAIERALILEESELLTVKYMPQELLATDFARNQPNVEQLKASRYISFPADGISLDTVEMWLIQEALNRCGGNVTHASELLRVSRDRIRYHLKKNKMERAETRNYKREAYKRI